MKKAHQILATTIFACVGLFAFDVAAQTCLTPPYPPTALLHFDGINNARATSDIAGHSVILSGAALSTTQAVFGPSSLSVLGGAAGQGAQVGNGSADFSFGTGDFHIEARIFVTNMTSGPVFIGAGAWNALWLRSNDAVHAALYWGGGATQGTIPIPTNQFVKFAIDRIGATITTSINGVPDVVMAAGSFSHTSAGGIVFGGDASSGAASVAGYVDEAMVIKGHGLTPSTPATLPYCPPDDCGLAAFPPSNNDSFGGRLTLCSGRSRMSADVIAAATLYYAPDSVQPVVSLWNGATWQRPTFTAGPTDRVGLALPLASWAANSQFDVFVAGNGAPVALCTGVAWTSAELADRGLTYFDGVLVNSSLLSCKTSASTAISCATYQCSYVGSFLTDAAGSVSCYTSLGQARYCGIWNAYNQIDLALAVNQPSPLNVAYVAYQGCTSGCTGIPNNNPAWQPFANDANNAARIFTGLPTDITLQYAQGGYLFATGASGGNITTTVSWGIGWDNVTFPAASSGRHIDGAYAAESFTSSANLVVPGSMGLHTATMLWQGYFAGSGNYGVVSGGFNRFGTFPDVSQLMTVRYKG